MNMSKHHITKLASMSTQLPDLIANLDATGTELARQMGELKSKGLIYATEHWKDRKYMTLLYPIRAGEPRKREYVGKDPVKVQEAKDKIQRAKEYDALAAQVKQLDTVLVEGLARLQEVTRMLSKAN